MYLFTMLTIVLFSMIRLVLLGGLFAAAGLFIAVIINYLTDFLVKIIDFFIDLFD